MAGTDITNMAAFFKTSIQTQQNMVSNTGSTGNASAGNNVDFSEYMKANTSASTSQQVQKDKETVEPEAEEKDLENTGDTEKSESIVQQNKTESGEETKEVSAKEQEVPEEVIEIPEELRNALEEIQNELMQKIMDSFEITESELKTAMEMLAINIFDLLQTDKLKEFAVYVSGEENIVSLITNDEMYTAYKEAAVCMEEVSSELMESFSMTPEELEKVISQIESISNEPVTTEENAAVTVPVMETAEEAAVVSIPKMQEEQTKVLVEITKESEPVLKEQKSENDVKIADNIAEEKPDMLMQAKGKQSEQESSDILGKNEPKDNQMTQKSSDNSNVQTAVSYSTIVTETEVKTVVQTQRTDFEGIVKQIVEQIKVQIKPDTTSMELQLNPENLGKVNLQVSSKEGAVTAQLFVQNEAVKTMIEGQLSVLREAMNQQGVKVEAVEVTVETGSFGRDLEQHSEQQKQEAEQQAKSYRHRQINLLAGMDEEVMNDEELLRAHIMQESGNSVDMNA